MVGIGWSYNTVSASYSLEFISKNDHPRLESDKNGSQTNVNPITFARCIIYSQSKCANTKNMDLKPWTVKILVATVAVALSWLSSCRVVLQFQQGHYVPQFTWHLSTSYLTIKVETLPGYIIERLLGNTQENPCLTSYVGVSISCVMLGLWVLVFTVNASGPTRPCVCFVILKLPRLL